MLPTRSACPDSVEDLVGGLPFANSFPIGHLIIYLFSGRTVCFGVLSSWTYLHSGGSQAAAFFRLSRKSLLRIAARGFSRETRQSIS